MPNENPYLYVKQLVTLPNGEVKEMNVLQAEFHDQDPQKPLTASQETVAAIAIVDASLVKKKELKPNVRKKIEESFIEAGLTPLVVAKTHARNLFQEDNLSVSQAAIESYYKLTGVTPPEHQPQLNVLVNINEVKERVEKIFE